MAVATINWALLLITGSLSLLDLCKYANATLIHTSNYVPFNMWQSGTLSLWLTGKSVGSVKNLRNDSALKRLCRETTAKDNRAARPCLLSSTVWLIQVFVSLSVETCWKYAASPSCLFLPEHTKKAYANWIVPPGVFGNVHHGVFAVSEPARGQVFLKSRKSDRMKVHFTLQLSRFLWLRPIKFHNCMTMTGFICTWQLSEDHFFQGINSVLETFAAL